MPPTNDIYWKFREYRTSCLAVNQAIEKKNYIYMEKIYQMIYKSDNIHCYIIINIEIRISINLKILNFLIYAHIKDTFASVHLKWTIPSFSEVGAFWTFMPLIIIDLMALTPHAPTLFVSSLTYQLSNRTFSDTSNFPIMASHFAPIPVLCFPITEDYLSFVIVSVCVMVGYRPHTSRVPTLMVSQAAFHTAWRPPPTHL